MSIGKRFVHLVRSNLNSLLERDETTSGAGGGLERLSDAELEAELQRRKARREAAEQAAAREGGGQARAASTDEQAWREMEDALHGSRYRSSGERPRSASTSGPASGRRGPRSAGRQDQHLASLYARLECPYGADLDTVRKQYRIMMRKYHPDVHSGSTEKQRLATELSQQLTAAYNELRSSLS